MSEIPEKIEPIAVKIIKDIIPDEINEDDIRYYDLTVSEQERENFGNE